MTQQSTRRTLLGDGDFARFILGRLAGEIGSRVTREGLPIVAILVTGATAADLGVLAALSMMPALILGSVAGPVTDRHRRRPLLVLSELVRSALLFSIPVAALFHRLTFVQIAIVTALVFSVAVFYNVADRAYLPFLVTRGRLAEGNRLVSGAEAVGESAGPLLMGVLIQLLGSPFAILFDALARLASAFGAASVRKVEPAPAPGSGSRSVGREAAAGMGIWTRHPVLRWLGLTLMVDGLMGGFHATLYELYALRVLHLSPFLLGVLVTAGGVGSLIGSLVLMRFLRGRSLGSLLFITFLLGGLANTLIPLAHGAVLTAFLFLLGAQLLGDLFATIFEINARVLEQSLTPDQWLGRVEGALRTLTGGLGVAGAVMAGLFATWLGTRDALWISAIGSVLTAGVLLAPEVRRLAVARYEWEFPAS